MNVYQVTVSHPWGMSKNTEMNEEVAAELDTINALFTSRDYDELEARLRLRAATLGWTGDPLQQPPEVVLAEARSVLRDRGVTEQHG